MIPTFATHYHLPDREPFLSVSELEGDVAHPVFQELLRKHQSDIGYWRRYGEKYLVRRREAEDKLRSVFVQRGGRPTRRYPAYFVLGASKWFSGLNRDHQAINVPLSAFPAESTSVTFPDSYIAMCKAGTPYYEKVYCIHELADVVAAYGLPIDQVPDSYEKYWLGDFEHYIEIQVWDESFIENLWGQWRGRQSASCNDRSTSA